MARTNPQIAYGVRSPTAYPTEYVGDVGILLAAARNVPDGVARQQYALGHDLGVRWAPVIPYPARSAGSLANLETVVSDLEADDNLRPQVDWDELDGWVFVRVLDERGLVTPLASYAMAVRQALDEAPLLAPDAACETVNAQREVIADRLSGR